MCPRRKTTEVAAASAGDLGVGTTHQMVDSPDGPPLSSAEPTAPRRNRASTKAKSLPDAGEGDGSGQAAGTPSARSAATRRRAGARKTAASSKSAPATQPGPAPDIDGQEPPTAVGGAKGSTYKGERSTGYRARSFYLHQAQYDRLRNAQYWTRDRPGGFSTLSELVAEAGALVVEQLEREHNAGRPFPDVPASGARRGPSAAGVARQAEAMQQYWRERLARERNDADED